MRSSFPLAPVCALVLLYGSATARPDLLGHPRRYLNTSSTPISAFSDQTSKTETPSEAPKFDPYPSFTSAHGDTFSSRGPSPTTIESTDEQGVPTRPPDHFPGYTSSPSYSNYSSSRTSVEITTCVTRKPDENRTVWLILPNPTTLIVTLGGNYTTSLSSPWPEFTPPTYCPEPDTPTSILTPFLSSTPRTTRKSFATASIDIPLLTSVVPPLFTAPPPLEPVTTIITTSKNPVTSYITAPPPKFPGDDDRPNKQTVDPNNVAGGPAGDAPFDGVDGGNQVQPTFLPIVTTVQGVAVKIEPSYAVIGGTTYSFPNPTQPAQPGAGHPWDPIIGAQLPTNVVIIDGGIFSAIDSSIAVFDGRTIRYDGASTTTTVFHRETITLGASISFDGTTLGGTGNSGTQLGIAGGISVTQVGQSIGIISSTTLTVGPEAVITTVIIDTYTIVASPGGLVVGGTTLTFPFNPLTQVMTVGNIVLTQIGSSLLVVGGSTYTIGGSAKPLITSANNRQTISLGSTVLSSATSTTDPQSSLVSSKPAETSKKSDGHTLKPVYIFLGICIAICIGSTT